MVKEQLKNVISSSWQFSTLVKQMQETAIVPIMGIIGSARSLLLDLLFEKLSNTILCLLPTEDEAQQLNEDLIELLGDDLVSFFPAIGRQAWGEVGPSSSVVGGRISVLKNLLNRKKFIVVTSAPAILEKVANRNELSAHGLQLHSGLSIEFESVIESLVRIGYVREERVNRPGEMSVRGGLIDVFLYEELHPFRIECFGDQIESIREFDVESQRSIRKRQRIDILPLSSAGPYIQYDENPLDSLNLENTVLEYFPADTLICFFNRSLVLNELEDWEKNWSIKIESLTSEQDQDHRLQYSSYYSHRRIIEKQVGSLKQLDFGLFADHSPSLINFAMQPCAHFSGNLGLLKSEALRHVDEVKKESSNSLIAVLCDSEAQTNRLKDLFVQESFPKEVQVRNLNLSDGFLWPDMGLAVYTNKNIYGRQRLPKARKIAARKISFKDFAALKNGDFVVHADYGIGIYRGLKRIKAYDRERECLIIEYRDGDIVYVPLEKMDCVQKYSSRESVVPSLNKLGTADWERLKKRTKERVKEVASQLIKLYAIRKMKSGYAFSNDTVWQKELEASFTYEETVDQLNAVNEIKADMEKPIPMERLVCGDVGYGKTEVAIRAAFKALNDGKQVCVLVPTTVLAQQHYATFSERLKPFPVKIEMLSRFRSATQQKEIVAKLAKGEIDLIIGTHRLLSKDVKFSDLGFLVVDEEQKFGVLHKERLKILKATVDTLSLSATPIPRTMHLALMGARDMSIINTPPSNRHPVNTEVCRFDREHIREAILKEVERGGQVFFVHNRVQSIHAIAGLLRELVPEVSFAVGHGQMNSAELEKIMLAFSRGEIQCLICTMIIESGIDMPNANTLIVNRADRFGLSQLYQLRGRVGRSKQQAFAYLLVPPLRKLSRTAIKRLQTIQEHTDLGSGYKIAVRDLEIRGAGNIFGAEQSGFVDGLGFELYAKIIEDAIRELKADLHVEPASPKDDSTNEPKINMNVDAYLPPEYVSSAVERVDIYKRLIEARTPEDIHDLQTELVDRFGAMPEEASNLTSYILIKILSKQAKIEEIALRNSRILAKFSNAALPKGEQFRIWLGKIVQKVNQPIEIKQEGDGLLLELKAPHGKNYLELTKTFLQNII